MTNAQVVRGHSGQRSRGSGDAGTQGIPVNRAQRHRGRSILHSSVLRANSACPARAACSKTLRVSSKGGVPAHLVGQERPVLRPKGDSTCPPDRAQGSHLVPEPPGTEALGRAAGGRPPSGPGPARTSSPRASAAAPPAASGSAASASSPAPPAASVLCCWAQVRAEDRGSLFSGRQERAVRREPPVKRRMPRGCLGDLGEPPKAILPLDLDSSRLSSPQCLNTPGPQEKAGKGTKLQ